MRGRKVALAVAMTLFGATASVFAAPAEDLVEPPPFWIGYNGTLQHEEVPVVASSRTGTNSLAPLQAGIPYGLTVRGQFQSAANQRADAECTRDSSAASMQTGLLSPWWPQQYPPPSASDDVLDVYINSQAVRWEPLKTQTDGARLSGGFVDGQCDAQSHAYSYVFIPTQTAPANFKVFDTHYPDNGGYLYVSVKKLVVPSAGRLLETLTVDSANPGGVTSSELKAGRLYSFVARGAWQYDNRLPGAMADAECSTSWSDPTWKRTSGSRPVTTEDILDLKVEGGFVEWVGDGKDGPACSASSHSLRYYLRPTTARSVNFSVADSYYADNVGSLTVDVYLMEATNG